MADRTDRLLDRVIRLAVREARAERKRRQELQARVDAKFEELAEAQRATAAALKAFSLAAAATAVTGTATKRRLNPMGCGNSGLNSIQNAIRPGARKVFCVKFQREMEGLDEVPFEGHPLGQKIYENVSKEAWKMWVEHMKMLMNEYRLNLGTKRRRSS